MSFLVVAAITVGGNLLAGKIASNRQNDPKAAIGSGTAPSLDSGADIQITPVKGSEVQDFGDFGSQNMIEPEGVSQQEQLLAYLASQGISPEEFGIMGAAMGGPLYKANGGGIDALLKQLGIDVESLTAPSLEGVVDFTNIEPMDPYSPDALEISMNQNQLKPSIDDMPMPEVGQEQTMMQEMSNYAGENPEMFNAGIGAITKVLGAVFNDPPEQKGSMVSTQTLPGNSARRRSTQMNIQPIGGSKVTFANEGTALKRPMFMPQGGQMRGPGGPKDDLIPVMASNGEYMLSKAAVDAAGNGSHAKGLARLDAFNKMGNKRYG
jgi:hypothetical protein